MIKERILALIFTATIGAGMLACTDDSVPPVDDLDAIWEEDLQTIADYITENNLSPVDTTPSGARYIIQDFGDSIDLEYNDIATVDYIASDINGIVFGTTIQEVADTVFSNFPQVDPWTFTYTETGWTLELTKEVAELQGEGLKEALTASLGRMQVGGHVTILLPSALGFGANSDGSFIIPFYSVLKYEVYLKHVR